MRGSKLGWPCTLALVVLLAFACTNDSLDDGDSPDVVLEIGSLDNSPVTAAVSQGLCAGDGTTACAADAECALVGGPCLGGCTLEVVDWTGTASNVPLNALAGSSPFNDIILESVTIVYDWIDDAASTPTRVVGLGSVTVPAGGSNTFSFAPISFQDLTGVEGLTANLALTFNARTVEGERVTVVDDAPRQLFVEACTGP